MTDRRMSINHCCNVQEPLTPRTRAIEISEENEEGLQTRKVLHQHQNNEGAKRCTERTRPEFSSYRQLDASLRGTDPQQRERQRSR